jgi:hypothetical protein
MKMIKNNDFIPVDSGEKPNYLTPILIAVENHGKKFVTEAYYTVKCEYLLSDSSTVRGRVTHYMYMPKHPEIPEVNLESALDELAEMVMQHCNRDENGFYECSLISSNEDAIRFLVAAGRMQIAGTCRKTGVKAKFIKGDDSNVR